VTSTQASPTYPLAGSVFLDTGDAEVARREMSKILAPHAMIPAPGPGPFHARHHHARLAGMSVNYIQYRPGATISADLSRRFFLIYYVLNGTCDLGAEPSSRILHSGDIAVINPTEPFALRTSDDCGQIVIKLESKVLSEIAVRRFSLPADEPIRFEASIAGARDTSLASVIDLICREADRIGHGDTGQRTEHMLAELFSVALIEYLPHNYSDALHPPSQESGIAPWYVKRVEEFIELHAGAPLNIKEMTSIAGVSERTLYNGFRTWRGTSPKSYLKAVRLDRVRTELLGLHAKSQKVSDIARACGFRHLGNFARDYRQRFGERPSDTLRFSLRPARPEE
jgi:AraC-like DNA-binding protein